MKITLLIAILFIYILQGSPAPCFGSHRSEQAHRTSQFGGVLPLGHGGPGFRQGGGHGGVMGGPIGVPGLQHEGRVVKHHHSERHGLGGQGHRHISRHHGQHLI